MSRNYKKEYETYHSKPEQKIRRAARNAARKLFKDADPNKDVHHKDNNPLNNDKNNLSLVTQHYNRREPRLRQEAIDVKKLLAKVKGVTKQQAALFAQLPLPVLTALITSLSHLTMGEDKLKEGPLVIPNEIQADQAIADKMLDMLRHSTFQKKVKLAKEFGIKLSKRGKSYQIEGALDKLEGQYFRNKVAQIIQVSGRNDSAGLEQKIMYQSSDALRKSTRAFQLHFQKQRSSSVRELIAKAINKTMDKKDIFQVWDAPFAKIITAFGEDVQEKALGELPPKGMSHPDAKKLTSLMQHYFKTKNPRLKIALLRDINKLQLKLGLKKTEDIQKEDMGTVTGPHIAGTGDDSSTVKVRKKKKVRRRKDEGSRMSPSMRDWEKRQQLAKQVRRDFWKNFRGKKKKDVTVKFKLKNSKSLKKRVIDNVLAIQQKV